jgi:hypothetical protein
VAESAVEKTVRFTELAFGDLRRSALLKSSELNLPVRSQGSWVKAIEIIGSKSFEMERTVARSLITAIAIFGKHRYKKIGHLLLLKIGMKFSQILSDQ